MHPMRRKDKEIAEPEGIRAILKEAKHITVAMSLHDEPYLATLSHGFDEENGCVYFHCAREGKKVEILRANPVVQGQALLDNGYQQGSCDHLYRTTQFRGRVSFVKDLAENEHALRVMIRQLDDHPEAIMENQVIPHSVSRINIGRIDIDVMTGKRADKVIIQL